MFPNPIKTKLTTRQLVIGTMIVQVRNPAIVQLFAQYDLDALFIDMEHGPYTLDIVADLILTARATEIVPIVRVGDISYHSYTAVLDAGALGIMTPRVENPEQVAEINHYLRYPPLGERGFSRLAAHAGFSELPFNEYVKLANENIINIIQIESETAVKNLKSILKVPGIDGILVGVDDLAMSMKLAGDTRNHRVDETLERIFSTCEEAGVPWGLHIPEVDRLTYWLERGMKLAIYSSDVWMLQHMLKDNLPVLRSINR